MISRRVAALAVAALILLSAAAPRAAELVMFEEPGCPWCALWHEEVGGIYHRTEEGRRAPLRRIEMHGPQVEDLNLAMSVRYSPTFVVMHDGVEIGRIEGYPGADFFWGLLGRILEQTPESGSEIATDEAASRKQASGLE